MAENGTILDRSLASLGITQDKAVGSEVPAESEAPEETPVVEVGTPIANVVEPTPTATPPGSEVQNYQEEIKRLDKVAKDNQAQYTRQQQEIAELKRQKLEYERRMAQFSPTDVAVAQMAQAEKPTETEGQLAMRRLIEQNPDLMDDPQKQVKLMGQISANTTMQLIRDYDIMKTYAADAKQVLGEDFNPSTYDADAWEAYQIHKRLGKAGNPYLSAVAVVNQDMLRTKLTAAPQKEAEIEAREIAQKANVRMERPGNPVTDRPQTQVRLSDQDYLKVTIANDPEHFPSFSRKK